MPRWEQDIRNAGIVAPPPAGTTPVARLNLAAVLEIQGQRGDVAAQAAAAGALQPARQQLREAATDEAVRTEGEAYAVPSLNHEQCYLFLRNLANIESTQDSEFARALARSQGFQGVDDMINRLRIDSRLLSAEAGGGGLTRNPLRDWGELDLIPHFWRNRIREAWWGSLSLTAFAIAAPPAAAALGVGTLAAAAVPTLASAAWSLFGAGVGSGIAEWRTNCRLYRQDTNGNSVATKAADAIIKRLINAKKVASEALERISAPITPTTPELNREQALNLLSKVAHDIIRDNCQSMADEVYQFWRIDSGARVWQAVGGAAGSLGFATFGPHVYGAIAGLINQSARAAGGASYQIGDVTYRMINNTWQATMGTVPLRDVHGLGASWNILVDQFHKSVAKGGYHLGSAIGSSAVLFGRGIASRIWEGVIRAYYRRHGRRAGGVVGNSFGDHITT